jgi:ABC-2 type transport system ATP-binding protein
MLLTAAGISKHYGRNTVLDRVGFTVQRGEVLGLIGPNGSGKTTLFECLARLIPADSGIVAGGDLFYLPDAIRPWPDQRVRWLIGFFERMYGADAAELVNALKLAPFMSARVGSLSKGELKRVMLAIGLLTPHALLLLDEPFDGLDFRQTRDVMSLLRTYPATGRTLFLSIHQLNDAARVCDRLILLSQGRVAGVGTIDELRAQAGLEAGGLEEIFLALTA